MSGPTKERLSYELCVSAKKHLNAVKAIKVNPPGSPHFKQPLDEIRRLKVKIEQFEQLWLKP